MRVLVVSDSSEVMGTEHSLINIADPLARRGVTLTLAARPDGTLETRWNDLGLPFEPLDLTVRQGFRPHTGVGYHSWTALARLPLQTTRAISRIANLARSSKADIIHSNSLMTHLDCASAGRLARIPSVLELHDIVAPGIGRTAMGAAVALGDATIAISTAVRDQLPPSVRGRTDVIPQGVDPERFRLVSTVDRLRGMLTCAPDSPLVGAIGRIDPEKGLHTLVRAVALARTSGTDIHLVLVGSPSKDDGAYLAELTRLGDELLGSAFRILPHTDDVAPTLHALDILACPSPREPFGLVLLEAQASGLPVVASAAGGPLDFIIHDETGLLVAPEDTAGFAQALNRLATERDLRERIAGAGRAAVLAAFTNDIRANAIADLYARVARLT